MTEVAEPVEQGDDLDKALAKIRGQTRAPVDDVETALRALRQKKRKLGATDSGLLRPASESTGIRPFTYSGEGNGPARERTGDFEAGALAVPANILSAAQAVPGAEAFEAKAGSLGSKLTTHPMSYRESLDALRSQTDAIPGPIKAAGRLAAGGPLASISASPMAAGAALGAGDQLADADPDRGVASRLEGAVVGGTAGAAIGGTLDALVTKARALKSPSSARVIRDLKSEREAASGPLFHSALTQGAGLTAVDPDVAMFVSQPKVKGIIDGLKELKEFQGVPDDAPEMLDAVYKVLSDQSAAAKRGLESVTPNKPNLGRFTARDIRATKDEALTAMDASMPDYKSAIKTYADYSGQIDAVRKGQDAVRGTLSKGVTTGKNLDRTTREAYEDWLARQGAGAREGAEKGILGATKQATSGTTPLRAISALVKSPGLLRATNTKTQQAIDALIRAGLVSVNTVAPH